MINLSKIALRALPALAWEGVIFWLSSQPSLGPSPIPDWAGHFFLYSVLAVFYWWFLEFFFREPVKIAVVVIAAASVYGITDELHQYFVPTRTASSADWVVDTFAAICVAVFFYKLSTFRKNS